ncbi:MAG: glycoside hydrolase family 25 protein [Rhizobium sp.]|nr:glycoside hydrolase family 25 protein [Rhizobium sp.]
MRFSAVPAIFLACLTLSGCISGSDPESVLSPAPSRETTGAVAKTSRLVPAADIGAVQVPPAAIAQAPAAAAAPVGESHELAWAGNVPQPQAFATTAMTVGMPMPSDKPIAAMVAPQPPAAHGQRTRSKIYSHQFRDAKPINFGKLSPKKYAVHGVDVSRWQGDIDWQKLRTQGANFAYIKATDGGDHIDPMFKTNWRRAKEAGIRRGAYHFFYWCRTAGEQADWFIRNVPRDPDALPPVIDVEYNGGSSCRFKLSAEKAREKMQVFMDRLERHYGKRPVIYTAPDFYKDNLRGHFLDYPFWLRAVAAHPSKVYPGRKWLFWQYSGSGLSHGVKEKIDLNVFSGSEGDWHQWLNAGRT